MTLVREDELAHFGIKGMQWGVRKAARQHNRTLNKQSRANDRKAHTDSVEAARKRINSDQQNKEIAAARAQFKIDKKKIGSREAAKKFNEVQQRHLQDFETAQMFKNGKEATVHILTIAGSVAVASLLGVAARR